MFFVTTVRRYYSRCYTLHWLCENFLKKLPSRHFSFPGLLQPLAYYLFAVFPTSPSLSCNLLSIPDSRVFALFINSLLFDHIWDRQFIVQPSSPLNQYGVKLLHTDILLLLIIRGWRKLCPKFFFHETVP